jgi:hypothetical protein
MFTSSHKTWSYVKYLDFRNLNHAVLHESFNQLLPPEYTTHSALVQPGSVPKPKSKSSTSYNSTSPCCVELSTGDALSVVSSKSNAGNTTIASHQSNATVNSKRSSKSVKSTSTHGSAKSQKSSTVLPTRRKTSKPYPVTSSGSVHSRGSQDSRSSRSSRQSRKPSKMPKTHHDIPGWSTEASYQNIHLWSKTVTQLT